MQIELREIKKTGEIVVRIKNTVGENCLFFSNGWITHPTDEEINNISFVEPENIHKTVKLLHDHFESRLNIE